MGYQVIIMGTQRQRKQVKVGFHQFEKDKLSKAAKARGMSMSRFIRELVLSVMELNKEK